MANLTLSADMDTLMQAADFATARTTLGLTALATTTPGTGIATALAINVGSAGAPILFNGAGGTPSSMTGTNITGIPVAGLSNLGSGVGSWLIAPSSFNLLAAMTDKTGTGVLAFGTSPTFTTSVVAGSTTMALLNTVATTVNAFGAATTLNIGAAATCILNFGGSTTASEFRFLEPSGSGTNYTAFKAVAQGASITYSLPAAVASAGQVLTDAAGDGVLSWATASGSGTISSGTTNRLSKYTAATTVGNSLVSDDGTTLTYTGTGGLALTSGSVAGTLQLTEGTAPSLVANAFQIIAPADVAAGGLQYIVPAAAATGFMLATDSSGVMTISHVGSSGSGNVVRVTSATLVTPTLGAATATSINGNTFTTGTYTLTGTAGKTLTFSNSLTLAGTDSTTMTFPEISASVGFRGVPQNAKTGSYTLLATDNGKVVPNTTGGWTVNNSVHTAGDVVSVYNDSASSQNITAGTITTMRLAGTTTTGTRALAARGLATLYFQTATEVIVSGAGVT